LHQAQQLSEQIRESAMFDPFCNIDPTFKPPANYVCAGFYYLLRAHTLAAAARQDAPAVATVIMFHGNGMNYGDTIYAAKRFVMRRCNVLILSYRGYV
jgi:hypothetical protein